MLKSNDRPQARDKSSGDTEPNPDFRLKVFLQ
jgi:hypothetical protein